MQPNYSPAVLRASVDQRLFNLIAGAIAGLVLVATPTFADAEMDQAKIKYRQTLMGAVGANMGGIGTILKNQLNLPGHVESHARQLAASAKLVGAAFEANLSEGATDAKPEIWSDWAGFEQAIADFEAAANTLAAAAASGDGAAIGPAVKGLGKTCGGCHDSFRKPKEESYKNQ
jgi:cytochrome c556